MHNRYLLIIKQILFVKDNLVIVSLILICNLIKILICPCYLVFMPRGHHRHKKSTEPKKNNVVDQVDERPYRSRHTHAGEKFWVCSTCQYWSTYHDEIKLHVSQHTVEKTNNKKYSCFPYSTGRPPNGR